MVQPSVRTLHPVPGAPRLSAASCQSLRVVTILDEHDARRTIHIPAERPLTVVLDGRELVTLMTLGACPELLVLGYLRNQRLVGDVTAIESIAVDWAAGSAAVGMRPDQRVVAVDSSPLLAGTDFIAGTGCGLGSAFAGPPGRIEAALAQAPQARISRGTLLSVVDTMRRHDAIHRAAGSVHSCALFEGSDLLVAVEDVSRHNGVDTVTGWMALHGVSGGDKILFTTGRLTGEMVMKSAHNGIPIVVSRNGVTAMGYDIGAKLGMTLIGRAANRRFLCYTGAERFDA